jgi:hypothetical protein
MHGRAHSAIPMRLWSGPHGCCAQYNHSKWKGKVFRVEVARPNYLLRLEKEQAEAEAAEAKAAEEAAAAAAEESASTSQRQSTKKAFYLPMPGRKRRVSASFRH